MMAAVAKTAEVGCGLGTLLMLSKERCQRVRAQSFYSIAIGALMKEY